MQNHEVLPFERNRYYPGKLLTSADFQAEQDYFNNKRRFANSLLYGMGVLCGLGVYSLDDLSVMIESGVAVDGYGREIVLEKSVVKKLSAVSGFDTLRSGSAVLGLRYAEEPTRPTYAINRQTGGEEYEPNHIAEDFEIFLANEDSMPPLPSIETDFFVRGALFSDNDYEVQFFAPSNISRGVEMCLTVQVSCKSETPHVFALECLLQAPSFTTAEGTHELQISIPEVVLAQGESTESHFWIRESAQASGESVFIAKPPNVSIWVDHTEKMLNETFLLKVNLLDETVDDIIAEETGRVSLEELKNAGCADYIPLAILQVQVNQNTYVIEEVADRGVKPYLPLIAQEWQRRYFASYFRETHLSLPQTREEDPGITEQNSSSLAETNASHATGLCEIPFSSKPKRGDVFHSEEIMHGLGPGNVYIHVGLEYLSDDVRLDAAAKNVIYGDADLFSEDKPAVPSVRTAVKVMNERGSFVVAAKLMHDSPYALALVRWVAVRIPDEGDKTLATRIAGKSISATQPTVLLAVRENHYFDVKFRNMEPTTLSYELTENDSGEITQDGVYTAPGREGVYEIRIYCTELPLISTYAYAIVKKRDLDAEASTPGAIQSIVEETKQSLNS